MNGRVKVSEVKVCVDVKRKLSRPCCALKLKERQGRRGFLLSNQWLSFLKDSRIPSLW